MHQTQTYHDSVNPVWNETFEFPVAPEEFEQRYVPASGQDVPKSTKFALLPEVGYTLVMSDVGSKNMSDSYTVMSEVGLGPRYIKQ